MKEKHFCRCCLSEECYKDMTNKYYIGNKTENYLEMLLNVFNISVTNDDAQRCLICEECVSKLRDAAAFKKKVLHIQEIVKKNLCWDNNGADTNMDTKIEDVQDADYFDDNISDCFNDDDFIWDNFTQGSSQKGQVFVITLESKKETNGKPKTISKFKKSNSYKIEIEEDESFTKKSNKLDSKESNRAKNLKTDINGDDSDDVNIEAFDPEEDGYNIARNSKDITKRTSAKRIVKTKFDSKESDGTKNLKTDTNEDDSDDINTEVFDPEVDDYNIARNSKDITKRTLTKRIINTKAAKQNEKKVNRTKMKLRESSQTDISLKYKNENTLKLIQNSNLCLFRSLQNKFGCSFCQMKFPEFSQLREHSLTHTNPKNIAHKVIRLKGLSCKNAEISDLKCNLCSENCTDLPELTEHLRNKHDISFHGTEHYLVPYKLQDGFQCLLCELKFNTYMRLSVHMNTHYTNNVCEICGLSFINRGGLRGHVQSQHKEKKCSRCPAIFLTSSSKSKHLRQVHGIRNSKRYCNLCNKTFRYSYLLDEHKIQEHGVKRQVSSCAECGKTFLSAINLKTHVRSVHIKERNYPCTKCCLRFFTKCDQRRHERTHEDVRSFCCSYCEAKFKSKDSWRRHLKRQHGHVFAATS